ncbi:MAG: C4-dicarboxylate ABC transporter, partial [Bacteroidia bacterium]|nr:C4-dicarboxylate ABC transporter [Bacteroidia bacterium]
ADRAGYDVSERIKTEADQVKAQLIKEGIRVIPNSEIDMEAFRKAGEKAYQVLGITDAKDLIYKALGK